jgi:type II restriction/modification system DNA methylase subunit YeeA
MNTSNLKNYAPKARRDFIEAVSKRANLFGIHKNNIAEAKVTGGLMDIEGKTFDVGLLPSRERLAKRVLAAGFDQLMELMAYTWFNRLCAIRYMELQGYLDHGLRVLSSPVTDNGFEILEHAQEVADDLGLSRERVVELKLAGDKDEELYRELLVGQCHKLHQAMPFLFEALDDETELLLPDNLTRTDSLIRALVNDIPEEDWNNIEIIGWLYQFYISEKKDQVIGKVVASVDIPAATQLFTPNWIVKYMVQNSLGAQWLATYPDSPLKAQMHYYIEPAEQTDEVKAQLAAITPIQLNPEELTLIDPASGSGHILVEAYELFKSIYLERGYRQRDVPQLILEKNLFGLDIDERAAQLTGFALMMKGRADDRRLFERGVKLNVMALVDSAGFDAEGLAQGVELGDFGLKPGDLTELKRLFEHATTFGSLIQVPEGLAEKLPALKQLSEATSQDMFVSDALKRLGPLVQQAEMLAEQYDAVVANPPYMGTKGMNPLVKKFAGDNFPDSGTDLYGCFISRGSTLAARFGRISMVTRQGWMFQSSFQEMRKRIFREVAIETMAHLGSGAFGSISGEVVSTTTFSIRNYRLRGHRPNFFRLLDGGEDEKRISLVKRESRFDQIPQEDFGKIPGSPMAYWLGTGLVSTFESLPALSSLISINAGLSTGNNEIFQRYWYEVAFDRITFMYPENQNKWVPCNSGGSFRKWFGNNSIVVDWEDDGAGMRNYRNAKGNIASAIRNEDCYFKEGLTWNKINSGQFAARWMDRGFAFDDTGRSGFLLQSNILRENVLAAMVSNYANAALNALTPGMSITSGELSCLPIASLEKGEARENASSAVATSRRDWNAYERSWDFQSLPLLTASSYATPTLESSYTAWTTQNRDTIAEMKRLEEENNRLFIDAYGLADELTPDVPIEQITLTVNPAYRYGGKLTEEELWTRFRQDTMEELVSYAMGCMMGRYSLDAPGLIYAHSGNEGFDPSRYPTFPADDDGIVPLTDTEWFDDDAAQRVIKFISVAWDAAHLSDNLAFLAENLSPKRNESNHETIRRYLCTKFFKDHLQTYKKRPIYWLFSSGKQKAFECLVYLHRYNEGTLARMRTEYVTPLTGKYAVHAEQLEQQIEGADSTAEANRLKKELTALEKQLVELREFDAKLKHFADRRISLDLDDGVKHNYGKFGDLLAEVKTITGEAPEKI